MDISMSTTGCDGVVVNTQSGEDKEDIHQIIEDDEKSTKYSKQHDRGDWTNACREEGDGSRQGCQEHGRSSIG